MRDIDAILEATQSQVRSYLAALGVATCDIDDLAQEVYVAYARGDERPEGVEPIRWLKGIARNLANNHFRRQARRGERLVDLSEVLEAAPTWLPATPVDEQAAALRRCLGRLEPEHRDLFHRYYGEEEDAGTLAVAFARSVDGIRRLMMRLRHDLRDCIERGLEVR